MSSATVLTVKTKHRCRGELPDGGCLLDDGGCRADVWQSEMTAAHAGLGFLETSVADVDTILDVIY
jgi:hypothetical protein